MAHFGKDVDDLKGSRCVHIRSAEQTEHFTVYIITVTVGPYSWTVKHRYSEFHDLHEKLTASYKLDKSLLPPKKIFGNQTEAFIKKRQRELEIYLQTIILYLAQHIPSCLAFFLDFDRYEIHGITQAMAEDLYNRGESLLLSKEKYEVSTLQLYSLTERLKLPEPTCDSGDVKKDLGHILDFITRAKHLKVVSSPTAVGTSSIMMNKLPFDLTLFKSLQTLEICGCNFRLVGGLETVKQTLTRLDVHESTSSIKEILLQDSPHWRAEDGSVLVGYWDLVTEADFSHNSFSEIHDSIQLMPNLERFNLSHNVIESIQNLQWLSQLTHLDLSHNKIRHVDSLHTKMGNVKWVNISHNQLESLHGFAKLFSLQTLDVSNNKISSIEELRYVSQLPCVENLLLTGNSVTSTLDYRTKTLEMFGDRVGEVILDNQAPDQKELDTVAVLQALRKAKDVKISKKAQPRKNMSAVSLSDTYSQSPSGSSLSDNLDGKTSRTASPCPGMVSRSVPNNATDWTRKDPVSSHRSSSPYSQESVSSYSSVQEGEDLPGMIPEANPFEIPDAGAATPTNERIGEDTGTVMGYNTSNNNDADNCDSENNIYPHELIPEAHPFDLTIENPASIAINSQHLNYRGSVDAGQSSRLLHPRKSLPASSTTTIRSDDKSPQVPTTDLVSAAAPTTLPCTQLSSVEEISSSLPTSSGPSQKRKQMSIYNTADLPTASNHSFVLWLNEQLLTSGETTPTGDNANETMGQEKEAIMDILWCYVEQLSKPGVLIPCCAILTKNKIFIEKLIGLESTFPGVPELEPCGIIPMQNIQQIVIGQCHAFLRLEEAFVGKPGTLTVFGIESQGTKRFIDKLMELCQDLDSISRPECVDLTAQSDLLKVIVAREELNSGMASDRLAVAILVRLKNSENFNFLVLSENKVYCLDLAFVHWPPASFETCPDSDITFTVRHEFSIMDKICDIKIHPSEEFSGIEDQDNSVQRQQLDSGESVAFVQYELSLEVPLTVGVSDSLSPSESSKTISLTESSQNHSSHISYLFSSASYRDLFLDRLTNLRAELAHRMSPSVREEPEGGNEQLPDSDAQGLKPLHQTSKFKKSFLPSDYSSTSTSTSSENKISQNPNTDINVDISESCQDRDIHKQDSDVSHSKSSRSELKSSSKILVSKSSSSEKSCEVVSLTDSDTYRDNEHQEASAGASDTFFYSASPKDDLSVSPMSNFSRASISPPRGTEPTKRSQTFYSDIHKDQILASKADSCSLPSSFDWKKYYFKSPPNLQIEPGTDSNSETQDHRTSQNPNNFSAEVSKLRLNMTLEDIESSSEFESSLGHETEQDVHLKEGMKSYNLIHPLPTKLKPLSLMNGKEVSKFFHTMIADSPDGFNGLAEELYHVLWASVVPYTDPKNEIITLVMVSTYGIYLVSDTGPPVSHNGRPSWMTHSRNKSDSAVAWKFGTPSGGVGGRKSVKTYFVFKYKDLQHVNIGLFDQCIRLTGSNENSVFTITTRDSVVTEKFVQKLKQVLSLIVSSPMVERNRQEMEQDFYWESTQRTKSTLEGIVYTHPSQVRFVYPGEDTVGDILYLVNEFIHRGSKVAVSSNPSLWFYMLCYIFSTDRMEATDKTQPTSIIITQTHFCLAEEDIVTYPLPDFVRGLPENPNHKILDCRLIENLKRITLFHGNPHWVCLTFSDEVEDIVVDVSMDHFSHQANKGRQQPAPEVTFRLFVQSSMERDKMVQMLDKLWKQLVSQVGRILDINKI